jgi:hypothetical protein
MSPIELNFDDRPRTIVASLQSAQRLFADPPSRGRLFVAGIESGFFRLPRPAPGDALCLAGRRIFSSGDPPVAVYVYEPTGSGASDDERVGGGVQAPGAPRPACRLSAP